jgi:glutaminyl-peptide cyclotransferase
VRVLDSRPHATDAFTQGLLFHDGFLYESTGQRGRSTLRKVDPETGEVLVRRKLPPALFGEGLARVPSERGDRLVQLTWQAGLALVWDLATLERVGEHRYDGEGWGLAFDGEHLVMSDGSSTLVFRNPETFEEVSRVQVTLGGRPLAQLNELEWVDGALWANVWGATTVVRIDPSSGAVTATADLTRLYGLLPAGEAARIDVLNGIAFRPGEQGAGGGTFLVTGKLWPRLFEVIFEAPAA